MALMNHRHHPIGQLWLFPYPKVLQDRLGALFFRFLPRTPGVYIMRDEQGRPIYVGKAKSLRSRLMSYRRVHPNRDSRKTLRLVWSTFRIAWMECVDETAALVLENKLIQRWRPRFNRANVWQQGYACLGFKVEPGAIRLMEGGDTEGEGSWFGSFKGMRVAVWEALGRTLARRLGGASERLGKRCVRIAALPERAFRLSAMETELQRYLDGSSPEFCEKSLNELINQSPLSAIEERLVIEDLALLESFYSIGPLRNQLAQQALGVSNRTIPALGLNETYLRAGV